jgi:hypothetical protein
VLQVSLQKPGSLPVLLIHTIWEVIGGGEGEGEGWAPGEQQQQQQQQRNSAEVQHVSGTASRQYCSGQHNSCHDPESAAHRLNDLKEGTDIGS